MLTVNAKELAQALARTQWCTYSRILVGQQARLEAKEDCIAVHRTDLAFFASVKVGARIESPIDVLVDAKELLAYVKNQVGELSIALKGDSIRVGQKTFPTSPASDWPNNDLADTTGDAGSFSLPAVEFTSLYARISHAIAKDETRYYLKGAYIHNVDGRLTATTTDGYRMVIAPVKTDTNVLKDGFILPTMGLTGINKTMLKKGGRVVFQVLAHKSGCHRYSITQDDWSITGRAVDGTFPDYRRVVPEVEVCEKITFKKSDLQNALAATLPAEKGCAARITIKDNMLIVGVNEPGNDTTFTLRHSGLHEETTIFINHAYLTHAMKAMQGEDITFYFNPKKCAVVMFMDGDSEYVLMPMRA